MSDSNAVDLMNVVFASSIPSLFVRDLQQQLCKHTLNNTGRRNEKRGGRYIAIGKREEKRERERTDTMDKEEQKCIDMPRRDERRRKQKNAG